MTDEPNSQDIEAHRARMGYDSETILVEDDDDVEAHGMLGVAAAVVIMAGSAGGTMLADAGTALAPEPARLTAPLSGSTGATGAAYYVNTSLETTVKKWPSSYMYAPNLAPGTPCSPTDLAAWVETSRVIQATGNYRKCV